MNENFWEHLVNAASHLLDAKRNSDAERDADAEAASEARRAKREKSTRTPAPSAFSSAPSANPAECCIAKRRFKPFK
jgi:hypothetical protein